MNKIELEYFPYSLKLNSTFSTAKTKFNERKGFIIKLKSESSEGIGDVSPFPEFGSESYEEIENTLKDIDLQIRINIDQVVDSINETLLEYGKYPALHHGLEQALLNLICSEKKITLDKLLGIKIKNSININGVIGFDAVEKSVNRAKELNQKGYKTLKIKAGRDKNDGGFEKDYECISEIRNAISNKIKLRIDVNGKWSLQEAADNLKQLEKFSLEYAEQPVSNLGDFIELSKSTKVPLAADESIRNVDDAKKFIESGSVSYLIIKPMMLGGLLNSLQIIKLAETKDIKTVVSSSFESAIGRVNALIAASAVKDDVAHGLSVGEYFENDFLHEKLKIIDGKISLSGL
jgi:o-succinylbenzoate synthase